MYNPCSDLLSYISIIIYLQQLGCPAAVPLTNSLHMADKPRMAWQAQAARNKVRENPNTNKDSCPFRFGKYKCVGLVTRICRNVCLIISI